MSQPLVPESEIKQAETLIGAVFEQLTDTINCEADIEALLIAKADTIRAAADVYRRTKGFTKASENYAQFKADLEGGVPAERRLLHAWFWLCDRLVNAPTTLHTMSTMIFCVPLVADYLPATEQPQQPAQEQP